MSDTAPMGCTKCGALIECVRQGGIYVFAKPCGHRQGEGKALAINRALAKLRHPK